MTAGVVVLGSVNVDHVAHVERLPAAGETLLAASYELRPGGKGRNQAVAIARLGGRAAMVAATGDDSGGAELRADLLDHGVDVGHVVTVACAATGLALITVDRGGENTIVVHPGANACAPPLPEQALVEGQRVLLCSLEIPLAVVADAVTRARAAGLTTVVNAAPMRGHDDGTLAPVIAGTDVLIVNETEARMLVETGDQLETLLARWRPEGTVVIVTLGARGAVVITADGVTRVASPSVTATNAVGAGDAFAGMLALALAEGRPLAEAATLACAAGAIVVSRPEDLSAETVRSLT